MNSVSLRTSVFCSEALGNDRHKIIRRAQERSRAWWARSGRVDLKRQRDAVIHSVNSSVWYPGKNPLWPQTMPSGVVGPDDDPEAVFRFGPELGGNSLADHAVAHRGGNRLRRVQRMAPAREIARARRVAAARPLELRIDDELAAGQDFVGQSQRIARSRVAGNQTRNAPAGGRLNVREPERSEEASLYLIVERRARDPFHDHAEHDVIGVRIVPTLAGREGRVAVEEVGDLLFRRPHLSGCARRSAVNFGFIS